MIRKKMAIFFVGISFGFPTMVLLSNSSATAQILLPNGEPDPAFNSDAMQVWLRADSGIGIPDADGLVDAWADRSNHGNNAATINNGPR